MLRMYLALFVTLGILSSAIPGSVRATSDEIRESVSSPAHLSPDASSSTTPGQTNSTISSSYASVKISKRRRSITSSDSNDTVHKIRGSDGSSALRRAQALSPQVVSQTLLKMMETLEKMSERAERLSDDVKELRTASQTSIDRQGLVLSALREEVDSLKRGMYSRVDTLGRLSDDVKELRNASQTSIDRQGLVLSALREQVDSLKRGTYSRVDTLGRLSDDVKEFRNASQTSIDRQGLVLRALREQVGSLKRGTYSRVVRIEQSITSLERYIKFNRKAVFNVENIRQHMEKANVSARAQSVGSDLFLLDGYTAKINVMSMFEKNKVWLGVYLCFCSGSKDSLLQWPFRDDYTLSIFHPSSSAKDVHMKATVSTYSACPGSYDKPTAAGCNNICCGVSNVLSRESAEEGGYIYNGAITVGVTLD